MLNDTTVDRVDCRATCWPSGGAAAVVVVGRGEIGECYSYYFLAAAAVFIHAIYHPLGDKFEQHQRHITLSKFTS